RFSLPGHELRFHKSGRDGSGKCDAFRTGVSEDVVLGVLYQLAGHEKEALDRAEGLGYRETTITVYSEAAQPVQCFCYFATRIDNTLAPYTWYKEHVLIGAREAALPLEYIARIDSVHAIADPDVRRAAAQRAIHE
ncbi:MAG: gamma-glutamylcyclotransferase, partial [Gammaproteobacteria bacterium]|nr:gamma-glutamylcyclotransferase [Gammaproteobacteria bacterium]